MRQTQDVFADATTEAADGVEFPEVVAELEELGFVRIGRLRRSDPGALWREAAAYPKPVRTEYVTHRAVPSVVLAAPDLSAFATITWWWGMPDVRIRTLLSDGSVVETVRAWDRSPVPPRGHGRVYRQGDLHQEQLLANAPAGGRRMAVAEGSASGLWSAHRRRVSETVADVAASPEVHEGLPEALALTNRLARHQMACHRAQRRHGLVILGTILLLGLAVIVAALVLPPLANLFLLAAIVLALVLVLGFRRKIQARSYRWRYQTKGRPALAD